MHMYQWFIKSIFSLQLQMTISISYFLLIIALKNCSFWNVCLKHDYETQPLDSADIIKFLLEVHNFCYIEKYS